MSHDRLNHLLETEIEFERRLWSNRGLSTFRRNPTTWELLLLLASHREGFSDGLHEAPNVISTRYLGQSALLKFIREQRDAGLIRFMEHQKRSKRILQLDPTLVDALQQALEWHAQTLHDPPSRGEATPKPDIQTTRSPDRVPYCKTGLARA